MPAGRPPLWNTSEELEKEIQGYYSHCEEKKKPLTIAGLAVWLGVDRQTIYNYETKDEFFGTIKKARDHILAGLEEALFTEGKAGQIFLAKNYGYTDKQEIDQNIGNKDDKPFTVKLEGPLADWAE